ncbi:hypothetical protein GCM10012285_43450 [Streptomyces kronopolitis]|uniref:DUF7224 domain-containing protein n=1 Tax=Streptomyces kronopolitis TaxID=1612435 RepID=A0ABQ2JNB6_9ACTN|nr:hypothetical protein [Streptomyces kronopolitis]GGN52381.1 hypothetical protein GCM10012285_43450 [Streptomyces kronopolitis]
MLWRTVLRSSSASWLAPLLAAFVALLLSDDLTAGVTHGYWPSALGAATFALPFVAPACATAGAWEGTRLTRGNVTHWAPTRSGLGIALPLLAPVLVLGIVGMAVAAAVTISTGRPDVGTPPVGMVLIWLVILTAHAMAGFLLGTRLPLVVATPLALILSFVLTAYPAALEPLWLRHMVTGGMGSCCSLDQTPSWRAAASAVVLALGVIGAAVLALTVLRRRARTLLIGGALVAGLAGSAWLAHGLPADPVTARPADQLECAGDEPRVCLWPELAGHAAMVRENASDARHRLQRAGVTVPGELTMNEHPGKGALFIGAWPDPTPSEVRAGVGTALLPSGPPACAQSGSSFPGADAYGPTAAWLSLTAGAEQEVVAGHYGEKDGATAARVMRASHDAQLAWYHRNGLALRDCTTQPAPPPAPHAQGAAR